MSEPIIITLKTIRNIYNHYSIEILRLREESSDEFYKNEKLHNIKREKSGKRIYPKNYKQLMIKHLDESEEFYKLYRELSRKIRKLFIKRNLAFNVFVKYASQVRIISKREIRSLEKEYCAICLDTHSIKDLITTNCNHHFGICCFSKILEKITKCETEPFNKNKILCPMCRNEKMSLFRYECKSKMKRRVNIKK